MDVWRYGLLTNTKSETVSFGQIQITATNSVVKYCMNGLCVGYWMLDDELYMAVVKLVIECFAVLNKYKNPQQEIQTHQLYGQIGVYGCVCDLFCLFCLFCAVCCI